MVELCNRNTVDREYTSSTVRLLFELLHSTPKILAQDWTPPEAQRCPECLISAADATTEAACAHDHGIDGANFQVKYACWLWHRNHPESSQVTTPSLLECCRVAIRQHIMRNLATRGELSNKPPLDYAKALRTLALPSGLLAYLSYREMWPVANSMHKFQFRRGRPDMPPIRNNLQPFPAPLDQPDILID